MELFIINLFITGHHVVFEVKKAVINKLKTFKNAFGENCDVFSKSSFEVVPKIKEDKQFQSSHLQFADNSLDNPFVTLSQLIQLVYFISYKILKQFNKVV